MGYSTLFYAVDLSQLSNAIGSGEQTYVQEFAKRYPDEFEEDGDEDSPALRDVFAQLIAGDLEPTEHGHQYGYALEVLCRIIGTPLPDEDAIGQLGPLELNSPLETLKHPVDIAKEVDQFPRISFLDVGEVKAERDRLLTMDLSFPESDDIEEARMAYGECVRHATDAGQSIVTFYY